PLRKKFVPAVETPAYITGVGLPNEPLAPSNCTNTIPTGCGVKLNRNRCALVRAAGGAISAVSTCGKFPDLVHVTPLSSLFHKPSRREPKKRIFPSLGSTANRSPLK